MGVHKNISHDRFPRQASWLGKRVTVCFNYDSTKTIGGRFVRDDAEEPHCSIIALDDGRYMLTTECIYSLPG
jgi:hypothetical protein